MTKIIIVLMLFAVFILGLLGNVDPAIPSSLKFGNSDELMEALKGENELNSDAI